MVESKLIKVKKEHKAAILTLDHPPVNALSPALLEELKGHLDALENDNDAQVIIITGAGSYAFCAGADVKELQNFGPQQAEKLVSLGHSTFGRIATYPKPVIGAINNLTLGGGMELALACDLRISSDRARYGQPEVWLGLIPAWGGSTRLSRLIGVARAKELIFTGRRVGAEEAREIGLVNRVVPQGEALKVAREIAAEIAANAPLAVRHAKSATNRAMDVDLVSGLEYEADQFALLFATEDAREGMGAFAERRKPEFKGQ